MRRSDILTSRLALLVGSNSDNLAGVPAIDASTLFTICNTGVLPFWILLVVAPGWLWTQRLVHSALVPAVLASVYLFALITSPAADGGSMGSLAGVMVLFSVPEAALAGWVHYLAFDLFVGAWEVRDARRLGIHHGFVVPCLLLTLMLGPLGLAAYCALRAGLRGRLDFDEA